MPKIEIEPSDDLTEVAIRIDGTSLSANALQLDAIIEGLIVARAQLRPQHPTQPPLGQRVDAIVDPHYWTNRDPESGMSLLMLRHPGLGWLSFMLPAAERKRLAHLLIEQSQVPTSDAPAEPPLAH